MILISFTVLQTSIKLCVPVCAPVHLSNIRRRWQSFKKIYNTDIPPGYNCVLQAPTTEPQWFHREPESSGNEDMGKCVGNNVKRK